MKPAQRRDWLSVVSECRPDWKLAPLAALLEGLDAAAPETVWEGGVCGRPGAKTLAVRAFGAPARKEAAGLLKIAVDEDAPPPAAGLPWLILEWDAAGGGPARAAFFSGDRATVFAGAAKKPVEILHRPSRYAPRTMEDPALAKVLSEFDVLCPVRDLVFRFAADGLAKPRALPSWSLRLRRPVAWPLFARLDMAAAFAAESSQLAFFVQERRVTELGFEEGTPWAYFRE